MRTRCDRLTGGAWLAVTGVALAAMTGCSGSPSEPKSSGSSTSASSSTSAATSGSSTPTTSSSAGSQETQGPSAATPTRSGDPALILANQPLYPATSKVTGDAVDLTGKERQIGGDGVLLTDAEHARITAKKLTADAAVVWMSDSFVLDTTTVKACANSCRTLHAPAGAKRVLVIDPAKVSAVGVDTPVTK